MSVTITYPKLKLAAQLREAGGQTVAASLEAASANLEALRPACLEELRGAVATAAAAYEQLPAHFDAEALQGLYRIGARAVGLGAHCGAPGADAALASLCDLLDRLGDSGRWDLEAIGVHVGTLQLLTAGAGASMDEAATQRVLHGLRQVSARYATPTVAAAG
jgi:hypothetical protein